MRVRLFTIITLCLSLFGGLFFWQCNTATSRISYNQDIRPIFNAKCLACHGGVRKSGGFSLLFREEAFATTESGKPAIVPGHHGQSELYQRLTQQDPELRMPLESDPLTEEEISLIARWIDEGAEWEEHWAYIPPEEVSVPENNSSWTRNDIDRFVAQSLQEMELEPAPEADRPTLIRRLSLDLTGLPPTPEAVDKFVQDPSENAYEKLVDSLLASSHYGEHWAAMWIRKVMKRILIGICGDIGIGSFRLLIRISLLISLLSSNWLEICCLTPPGTSSLLRLFIAIP